MTVNNAIAYTTLLGAVVITIADAPEWEVESYIGLLAAMSGIAIVARGNPDLAKGFAGLIAVVLVLQRGETLIERLTSFVNR